MPLRRFQNNMAKHMAKHQIISSTKNKKGGNVSAIIADDNTITNPIEIAEKPIISLYQ